MRYTETIDPVRSDGRDIDTEIAEMSGEAADQRVEQTDERVAQPAPHPYAEVPRIAQPEPSYYGQPMLKTSVWSADIPLYYFLGGAAGAALTLASAIQLGSRWHRNPRELRKLSEQCHWIGIAGTAAGAAFLIHDLGRSSRFLYMMRVFRPSSPMNVGTWILAVAMPTAIASGLFINRKGKLGEIGAASGYISGIFGAALAGYTGVLVSNTVVPAWQQNRRWMPVLFISSAAATTASVLDLFYAGGAAGRIATVFGTAGRMAEIATAGQVKRLASRIDPVGAPFREGRPGRLWKASGVLTAASLAVSLIPGNSRWKKRLAGALGAAGSLCLRFAVHEIGNASAQNPRAAFAQQRTATS